MLARREAPKAPAMRTDPLRATQQQWEAEAGSRSSEAVREKTHEPGAGIAPHRRDSGTCHALVTCTPHRVLGHRA